jgi:regulation of enolase protein 1 (concanavalin A-like superfamily)
VWVKVTRSGDSFSGYYSTDGIAWAQIGPAQTVTMPRSALAGLAVTSHDTAASSTARFRNVSVTQP